MTVWMLFGVHIFDALSAICKCPISHRILFKIICLLKGTILFYHHSFIGLRRKTVKKFLIRTGKLFDSEAGQFKTTWHSCQRKHIEA